MGTKTAIVSKADVARQYRDKYGTEMPTLKLARIMYKKENPLFLSVERARQALAYIEGKRGALHKKKVEITKYVMDGSRPLNPYKLPDSDAKTIEPYKLRGFTKALVIADIHLQFH